MKKYKTGAKMAVIYLAGGCFWGMQAYFDNINGVTHSQVGYANSAINSPSYELVCSGKSEAAETLELIYDANKILLSDIISHFLHIIDPCALNFQGNDIGTQYRNGVYFINKDDEVIIRNVLHIWEVKHNKKAVTEILALKNFYPAESYHQKYLLKNPNGYCHIDIESALSSYAPLL